MTNPAATAPERPRLGEILLSRGLITKEQLEQALRVQVGGVRRLGSILVRMRILSDEHLTEAIASQLGLPVVDVETAFREEARAVLPRHLCRRFGVIPLAIDRNNVLRLGMADPSDREAIAAVEHFTGFAVEPELTRLRDITRSIPRRVALSRHDFLNPQVYRAALAVSVAVVLLLGALLGLSAWRGLRAQREGTVSRTGDSVIYQNHDLMVDVAADGTIYLGGRGAHTDGHFGVRFDGPAQLEAFVAARDRQLSGEQREWISWLMREKLARGGVAPGSSRPQ